MSIRKNDTQSRNWEVKNIYRELLQDLRKRGIGKKSDFNTLITERLVENIKERYFHLCRSDNGLI